MQNYAKLCKIIKVELERVFPEEIIGYKTFSDISKINSIL
jgi:hypothetical protein